ncbi:DUF58 domain-containing protein [Natronococcus sp. A-GB7]|uniref:DUF58 domain-containing protein n=1 Tax=Natronococcus sp. A-GB7 TaxID=3037649 RepID=UPI00241DC924|nr:DUF58 domain-containing protein [Natronococcus sp. A-GB7]MDG5819747.1 DUF58 domain-containing protein [Natronococcus sp. A-GB7]
MRPTPTLWATALLATVLAACAIVFARPELLFGTALIGAWILARQYRFSELCTATTSSLTVSYSTEDARVRAGDRASAALTVRAAEPVPLAVSAEGRVPPGVRRDGPLVASLERGDRRTERAIEATWPVAGRHRFGPVTVELTDGWFRETIAVASSLSVTVEPRGPPAVHVGTGGTRATTTRGGRPSRWVGSGPEFDSVREYSPGDSVGLIDWNATARLSRTYVRDLERNSNRPTLLVVDLRTSCRTAGIGSTPQEYLREAALSVSTDARRFGDPIGLVTLDDDGVGTRIDPAASARVHRRVRRRLLELGTTDPPPVRRSSNYDPFGRSAAGYGLPTVARSRIPADYSPSDDPATEPTGAFVESLRSFSRVHADRATAADSREGELNGVLRTLGDVRLAVLCTDDSSPRSLWKSVTTLRARDRRVLVLLAPTVLFEGDGLADLEGTYDRYVAFEELRRDLDRCGGVRALEVAPDDRLSTVLATGRDRSRGDRR